LQLAGISLLQINCKYLFYATKTLILTAYEFDFDFLIN
jgi:hypothetical protein